jgi:hypothetical protein
LARKTKTPRKTHSTIILPAKHTGIVELVRKLVSEEKYTPTGHAKKRLDEREVTIKEVRAALLSGKRLTSDDEFHTHDSKGNEINRWSYAFTKVGLDRRIKVCVSIDGSCQKPLLIVTVIDLD